MKKCVTFLILLFVSLSLSDNLYASQSNSPLTTVMGKIEFIKSKLFGKKEIETKEIEAKDLSLDTLLVEQVDNTPSSSEFVNNKNFTIANIFTKNTATKKVIISDKKSKTLFLVEISDDNIVMLDQYPAIYGSNNGDKYVVGDNKTPEGIYYVTGYISEENLKTRFSSNANLYGTGAFPLDYPNPFDKTDGKTGSGIWLHGNSVDQKVATQGCVAIENKNLDTLKTHIDIGTPVILTESIIYQPIETYAKEREYFSALIKEMTWHGGSLTADKKVSAYSTSNAQIYTHDGTNYVLDYDRYNCSSNKYKYDNIKNYFTLPANRKLINMYAVDEVQTRTKQLDIADLKSAEITKFVDNWATAWQSQDIDDYINFYSPKFRSSNRSYNQYKRYKAALFRPKNKISVNMDIVDIWISKNNNLYVKMKQKYSSRLVKDSGYKTLQLVGCNDNYLIVSERWSRYE